MSHVHSIHDPLGALRKMQRQHTHVPGFATSNSAIHSTKKNTSRANEDSGHQEIPIHLNLQTHFGSMVRRQDDICRSGDCGALLLFLLERPFGVLYLLVSWPPCCSLVGVRKQANCVPSLCAPETSPLGADASILAELFPGAGAGSCWETTTSLHG